VTINTEALQHDGMAVWRVEA